MRGKKDLQYAVDCACQPVLCLSLAENPHVFLKTPQYAEEGAHILGMQALQILPFLYLGMSEPPTGPPVMGVFTGKGLVWVQTAMDASPPLIL